MSRYHWVDLFKAVAWFGVAAILGLSALGVESETVFAVLAAPAAICIGYMIFRVIWLEP
jgi:hypothetical protein